MKMKSFLTASVLALSLAVADNAAQAQQADQPGMGMRGMGAGQGMMGGGMMGRGQGMMMGPGRMMGGGMGGPMMRGMMGGGCPMMGMMMGDDDNTYAKGRAAFLKAELEIKEGQEDAFQAYAAALRDNLQNMQSMRQNMMQTMSAETPVERLNAHLAMMEGRVEALKAVKPKLEALYAALDAAQKEKANRLLTGMGCMM